MESFYVHPGMITGDRLIIKGEEHHHISRVMRMKTGDRILAVDGRGTAYQCRIESISPSETLCGIEEVHKNYNEAELKLTLMLPILKQHNRLEWLVEKATEIGVHEFLPLKTGRSGSYRLRFERLEKIIVSAMKQCRRSVLPEIKPVAEFDRFVETVSESYDRVYIAHETAPVSASAALDGGSDILRKCLVLVGPEGGFTENEIKIAESHGAVPVSLGTRRLRSETAALVLSASILGIRLHHQV